MKITKTRVGFAAAVVAVSGIVVGLGPTSVAMEFAIFHYKLAVVLTSVMLCIDKE
ncbi:MAG: hypothetical protein WCL22_03390 [bacterium]